MGTRPIDASGFERELIADMSLYGEKISGDEAYSRALLLLAGAPTLTPPNEPLTLDQLREMDGQPVWIEGIGSDSPEDKEWALVFCKEKFCRTSCGNIAIFGFYGIGWLAYACPPAHIDREAWEPCEACKTQQCFNCHHDDLSMSSEPCRSCTGDKWEAKYKFCPECGRPMTPEARAMLEKRLRGCI